MDKTKPAHMLPIREPPQNKRPTKTKSEGLEKKYFKQMDRGKKLE